VLEESRALDGTHICAYDVLCCVVEITSYQLGCLSTAGSRSSDISESIVTALAGLQTLTSTFLHLFREVLKVRALGLQTVQTALELRPQTITESSLLALLFCDTHHKDSFKYENVHVSYNTWSEARVELISLVIGILRRYVWDEVTTVNSSETPFVCNANHEAYPNEPRPPQPCLGVSLKAVRPSVPDRRMSTLIAFCRSIEHIIRI
jgi:hypothetical protein